MTDAIKPDAFRLESAFRTSFAIFRRHFVPIVLMIAVGRLIAYAFSDALTQPATMVPLEPTVAEINVNTVGWYQTGTALLGWLVGSVTGALASAMVAHGVLQDLGGRRFSVARSFAAVVRRPLPVIGVGVWVGLAVTLGSVALVIPGLVAACVWSLAVPACVAERTGVFASLSRSRRLTRGHRWLVFAAVIPLLAVTVAVAITVKLGELNAGPHDVRGLAAMPITQLGILSLAAAFAAVLKAVVYWQLRTAKEGAEFDTITAVFD